jgi:hypothetical protein
VAVRPKSDWVGLKGVLLSGKTRFFHLGDGAFRGICRAMTPPQRYTRYGDLVEQNMLGLGIVGLLSLCTSLDLVPGPVVCAIWIRALLIALVLLICVVEFCMIWPSHWPALADARPNLVMISNVVLEVAGDILVVLRLYRRRYRENLHWFADRVNEGAARGGYLLTAVSGWAQNAWVLFDWRYPLGDIPLNELDDPRLDERPFVLDTRVHPPVKRRPIPPLVSRGWSSYRESGDDEPDEVAEVSALEFFATLPEDVPLEVLGGAAAAATG